MRVFVAAPFASGRELRARLPGRLAAIGVVHSCRWLDLSAGVPDDFTGRSIEDIRLESDMNLVDLSSADVALLVDPKGEGHETYSEASRAIDMGKPVVWYGHLTLSAFHPLVVRVATLDAAIGALARMREAFEDGARGEALALAGGGSKR